MSKFIFVSRIVHFCTFIFFAILNLLFQKILGSGETRKNWLWRRNYQTKRTSWENCHWKSSGSL